MHPENAIPSPVSHPESYGFGKRLKSIPLRFSTSGRGYKYMELASSELEEDRAGGAGGGDVFGSPAAPSRSQAFHAKDAPDRAFVFLVLEA